MELYLIGILFTLGAISKMETLEKNRLGFWDTALACLLWPWFLGAFLISELKERDK